MSEPSRGKDFLRTIVDEDLAAGRHQYVTTRFPPEPNGYLHIGHAKAICVDFGIAQEYGGTCNLRFDDTNPTKEEVEYVEGIERDVRWLGFEPAQVLYASDYFEEMYGLARRLIEKGLAYVDDDSDDEIKAARGTLSEPGTPSRWRDRTVEDNLRRFAAMRAGELPDGACVLRAKIDLAASNMKMRDPLLYRIRHAHHHRTGDAWCIYPMYDYAHPLSDAFEGITHSLCTLEFENNRELYDWVIEATEVRPLERLLQGRTPSATPPRQYEFARLNIDHTMMSKRNLLRLVQLGLVTGWDDPRMPTLTGLRRRGYTPEAIRTFVDMVGVAKNNSTVDVGKLEYAVRDDLNRRAPRLLGVLRPLAVTLTNWDASDTREVPLFPEDIDPGRERGVRNVPFGKHIYIDREDFMLEPPAKYTRLAPGRVVRLRYAEYIRCDEVVQGDDGEVVELKCSVMHAPGGVTGWSDKVWGVIHWVSADHAVAAEVRLYDRLFTVAKPDAAEDPRSILNPRSLEVVTGALVEPHLALMPLGARFQLERVGYFVADSIDSAPGALVLNRVITLRDTVAEKPADAPVAVALKSSKSKTRPAKKSAPEQRAIARERDPILAARHAHYPTLGLSADEADLLSGDRPLSDFFDAALAVAPSLARPLARWTINELPRELGDDAPADTSLTPAAFASLVGLVETSTISAAAGKDLLSDLVTSGGDPVALVDARGLRQVSSTDDLTPVVESVLSSNADKVAAYRSGKHGLLGFFVGAVMKASGGKANPATVNDLVKRALTP